MKLRAKFTVESKTEKNCGPQRPGFEVELTPVVGDTEENERFFRYTPYGKLTMGLVNPETAAAIEVGKTYYLELVPESETAASS